MEPNEPVIEKPMEKKDEDLPKSIVVILVVLAVAISVLGTLTVLTEMSKLNVAPQYKGASVASGEIRLVIEDPNAVRSSSVTGKILLNVEKKPEAS